MRFLVVLLLFPMMVLGVEVAFPWVVCYSDKEKPEAYAPYNPIVLDSEHYPPLASLIAQKKELLGYVNLGESETWRSWFGKVKEAGALVRENANWPGSWIVDIRNPIWKTLLFEEIIPDVLSKGFTGLFYDQLDVVIALEQEDPQKYKGMKQAAVDLVQAIRKHFPKAKIMMNRAYEILSEVGDAIDYELAESLYTDYDFSKKKYRVRTQEEYDWQMKFLNEARKQFPHLVLFSLDYWDPKDKEMYAKIYDYEAKRGLRPYVSTIGLDKIITP